MKIIWCMVLEIWSTRDWFFFLILGHFLIFYPTNNLKNQNIEKMKKSARRYHHFTQVYQKPWSCYTVPERWCGMTNAIFYFSFWAICCSFTTLTAWKIMKKKFRKNEKEGRTDGQTDGQKKWFIEVDAPPK